MKITFWKGVFVADHGPGDVTLLKKCGFTEHEPTLCETSRCKACRANIGRRYWSSRIEDASRLRRFCNERALSVMKEHLAKLSSSRATSSDLSIPVPEGLSYRPFQVAGIAYAVQRKDTLIADDMGLGKTVQGLGFINYTKPHTVLVIAPATLTLNWKLEAEKWLVDTYTIILPKNTSREIPQLIDRGRTIVITNYEKIYGTSKLVAECPHCHSTDTIPITDDAAPVSPKKVSVWTCPSCDLRFNSTDTRRKLVDTPLSRSLRQPWDLAIFDEAHALKNPESYRSRAVLGDGGIYDNTRRSLFLSGTPLENRPIEIWPIASRVCPNRFGDWWSFARRYCALHKEKRGDNNVWVADGSSHHSELQQRLRTSFMVRRLKSDVLKELPAKCRQMLVLSDEDVDWSKYPEIEKWKDYNSREIDAALARLMAARTMDEYRKAARSLDAVSIPFTETSDVRHKLGLIKLPACLKLCDQMLSSGLDSLAIFAHHRDVLQKIHDHYGDDSCVIYGDTPMNERMPIVQLFQEKKKRIFIGGLKAAGVGITLTRTASLIFFETDWNPGVVRQGEDRVCRIGQTRMVNIIHPVLDRSLDANMVKMILAKQNVVDKVLDNPTEVQLRQTGLALSY